VARANIFDTLGCSILEEKGELRIMDEIGFMENSSPLFQKAVLSALEDDIPTMACVKDKETPFLSSVRKTRKSLAFSLSVENRDSLTYEIKRAIHGTPEWLFASKLKTISE
ncbi:MAG: nucleoside-triphosphatase, partial [Sphaerochaetaceae bacterium]